jgi:hypothetical protein
MPTTHTLITGGCRVREKGIRTPASQIDYMCCSLVGQTKSSERGGKHMSDEYPPRATCVMSLCGGDSTHPHPHLHRQPDLHLLHLHAAILSQSLQLTLTLTLTLTTVAETSPPSYAMRGRTPTSDAHH